MPRDKLDLLRRAHTAFNANDLDAITDMTVQDVDWGTTGRFPGMELAYRGREGMTDWTAELRSAWQRFDVSLERVVFDRDDRLGVVEKVRGKGLGSGVEVEMQLYTLYEFHCDRIVRRRAYSDESALLAAVTGQ